MKDKNNIPKLEAAMPTILERVADKVGDYIEKQIRKMIATQYSGWAPLAQSTIARKGSSNAWIDTGDLRKEIAHRLISGTMDAKVEIGIFNHERAFVALCLEFGTDRIPERPLFRLVLDLEEEKILKLIKAEIGKELDKFSF